MVKRQVKPHPKDLRCIPREINVVARLENVISDLIGRAQLSAIDSSQRSQIMLGSRPFVSEIGLGKVGPGSISIA
jgi:hypothetical protein